MLELFKYCRCGKNKTVYLVILSILLSGIFVSAAVGITPYSCKNAIEKTVYGFDGCWDIIIPDDYLSIQMGIDHAAPGDHIFVRAGIYEENVIIDIEQLTLCGEKREDTIIDGGKRGHVVYITADEVSIRDLTLCNSGIGMEYFYNAALKVVSDDNIIQNISCLDTNYGIWVQNSNGNVLLNNYIDAHWDGISLDNSENNYLRNNSMYGSGLLTNQKQDIDDSNTVNDTPIYYYYNQTGLTVPEDGGQVILVNCSNFVIENLSINGTTLGISIFNSYNNIIRNNIIESNTDFGIILNNSNYNVISKNRISNNPVGIALSAGGLQTYKIKSNCEHNIISKNNITNNIFGLMIIRTNHNTITKNNFIENQIKHVQIVMSFRNRINKNYWDDWVGFKKLFLFKRYPKFIPIFYILKYKSEKPFPYITIPIGFNFDWHPAKEPYNF